MDAVGHNLLGPVGVGGACLSKRGHHGRVHVGDGETLALAQLLHKFAVADEHGVVSAFELGRAGHIVKGRRLNQSNADARQRALDRAHDVPVTFGVSVEDLGVVGAIARVVHAEHDGHDAGLVGDHVAAQAYVDGAAASARDAVAAPARMHEAHV